MYQHSHTRTGRAEVVRCALAAAEAGRAVFPLSGKVPLTPRGFKDASRDRSRVHALFNLARNATGYGIATGSPSRRIVVDIDGPEGWAEAERLGLTTTGYVVRTGREDGGRHLYFTIPPGVRVRSRQLAPGLELKGDGAYVAGPGSLHPSGRRYTIERGGDPSPAPAWMLEPERGAGRTDRDGAGRVSIDVAGPPIPERNPGRNRELTRICGRLHDGTRDLAQLTRDLMAINEARCTPPLEAGEVRKIAASIYRREPCKPRRSVSPEVLPRVDYLQAAAAERPVRGKGGASGWSIYHAGLEALRRFGREHPDGLTLTLDTRTWAQMAGTNAATVSRWLARTPLVEVLERGTGRRSSTVLFRVPKIACQTQHSSTLGDSQENGPGRSVAVDTLLRTLYRSRWSSPERKQRRGVVPGTRRVRAAQPSAQRGALERMGKSRAALLDLIRRNPGAARAELARLKGVKPASLTHPLRWLLETGLIVRTGRGRYEAADRLADRLADVRQLGQEPAADRQQIARHEREREAYRNRHRVKAERAPDPGEARERSESYPERRREHIAHAIARLFAEYPGYRNRRAGQITCKLPDYLAADFPRGPDGLPKDAEVETILDGVAA